MSVSRSDAGPLHAQSTVTRSSDQRWKVRKFAACVVRLIFALKTVDKPGLHADGSLTEPGTAVWTEAALEDLKRRFIDAPDLWTAVDFRCQIPRPACPELVHTITHIGVCVHVLTVDLERDRETTFREVGRIAERIANGGAEFASMTPSTSVLTTTPL